MNSLRTLARSAPRSASRFATASSRTQWSAIRRPVALSPAAWRQPVVRSLAAFHTSRCMREGQVNEELAAKLDSEIGMENDMRDSDNYPASVQEFLESSEYEIEDTPGQEEVVLRRKFGEEEIKVTFSIADLNNLNQEADSYNDPAMYDEDADVPEDGQSGGANTKGAVNQGRTSGGNIKVAPEDSVAPADRPELADDQPPEGADSVNFPARLSVRITRQGRPSALAIEAMAQDGDIAVDNVYFYPDQDLADPKTVEADWKRRSLYTGPPFGNLDEDLQILVERYLEERGINTAMALFVPDYIEWKEQREYLGWLDNVKSFVE